MKKLTLLAFSALFAASIAHAATWVQTFGGPQSDGGMCVQQTTDGGYVVSGFTYSFGDVGNANIWLIKLDSLGQKEWEKTYGEGSGSSVWQTSDGGYIIGGSKLIRTDQNGDTQWTRQYSGVMQLTSDEGYIVAMVTPGSYSLSLIKLNKDGDSLWAKVYSRIGNNADLPTCVRQTSDEGYIITGVVSDVDTDILRPSRAGHGGCVEIKSRV